jgi:tetratricopeptide (TPR) repeat protein
MKGLAVGLAFSLSVAFAVAAQEQVTQPGAGPARGAPAPRRNLQVLPKDMSQEDLVALMRQFCAALSVGCRYCHVEVTPRLLSAEEAAAQPAPAPPAAGRGRGFTPTDFAADDKRQKQTARLMIALVNDINARLAASIRKPPADLVRVQCATCHRGVTNPQQLSDLLSQTMLGKGEGAAVALYRELRQQYFGSEAYDFREPILLDLGRQSLANRKPDDALAWLQLNIEFYPKSAPSYVVLAQVHVRKNDQAAAIKDLQKAIELDPSNADAARELARLKSGNRAIG